MIADDIRVAAERVEEAAAEQDAAMAELRRVAMEGLRQGMGPQQVADATGMSRRTIYKWIEQEKHE